MPGVYRSPASRAEPGKTVYLGNAAKNGVFRAPDKENRNVNWPVGTRFREIRDGTSNTIAVLEVSDQEAVLWTRPEDFTPDEDNPLSGLQGPFPGGFHVVFCDGAVRLISEMIDKQTFRALLSRDGGEPIGDY
jgi:hypothetical protein